MDLKYLHHEIAQLWIEIYVHILDVQYLIDLVN